METLIRGLERGERPGPLVRHAGPQLRHELALRWFQSRNEHLGRVVRELKLTAREPDSARVVTQLKSGVGRLVPPDAPLLLRALSDPDDEVRQAAAHFLGSGLSAEWADALGVAALSEWSAETRLKVLQAGFAPADKDLGQVFGWVAGTGTTPDPDEVARITPRLTEEQRSVLASRLRKSGRGHLLVRTSLERVLEGRDGDALWAELTLGGSTDPLQDDEVRKLLVPHPTPLEPMARFDTPELYAGEDFLVVPSEAILALDDLRLIMEFVQGYPHAHVVVAGRRRVVVQPRWFSLPDIPHLTKEHLEPSRSFDLNDGSMVLLPFEEPLVGVGADDRLYVLQDPMVQCWDLTRGELVWQSQARWARTLLIGEGVLVVLGPEHLEAWDPVTGDVVASLDQVGKAAIQGDVLALETPPGLRLYGLPELGELAVMKIPGCAGWSWRSDGSLLAATSTTVQHWGGPDPYQARWRQQRSGKVLEFHPQRAALVASDGRKVEFFHPGSEFPDQVVEAEGRPRFTPDGTRLLVGSQVFAVRLELPMSRACPADLTRAAASPNRSARLVEALLRFRLRHEVLLGETEHSPEDIEL